MSTKSSTIHSTKHSIKSSTREKAPWYWYRTEGQRYGQNLRLINEIVKGKTDRRWLGLLQIALKPNARIPSRYTAVLKKFEGTEEQRRILLDRIAEAEKQIGGKHPLKMTTMKSESKKSKKSTKSMKSTKSKKSKKLTKLKTKSTKLKTRKRLLNKRKWTRKNRGSRHNA